MSISLVKFVCSSALNFDFLMFLTFKSTRLFLYCICICICIGKMNKYEQLYLYFSVQTCFHVSVPFWPIWFEYQCQLTVHTLSYVLAIEMSYFMLSPFSCKQIKCQLIGNFILFVTYNFRIQGRIHSTCLSDIEPANISTKQIATQVLYNCQ